LLEKGGWKMAREKSNYMFAMIAIVAIVAIVGIIVMFMNIEKGKNSDTNIEKLESTIDLQNNMLGEARLSEMSADICAMWKQNGIRYGLNYMKTYAPDAYWTDCLGRAPPQ
jgi:hypothetical protein